MPPLFGGRSQRQARIFANSANKAKALSQQQQGGQSGVIPGTSSPSEQVGLATGVVQAYPATGLSPNGGQIAAIGHQVLNNDGDPVVVMGNMKATGGTDHADFQDGGFAFVDAAGNQVAGYSQPTGLWGFGGGGGATEWLGLSFGNFDPGFAETTFFPAVQPPAAWDTGLIASGGATFLGLPVDAHVPIAFRVSSGGIFSATMSAFCPVNGDWLYGQIDPASVSPSTVNTPPWNLSSTSLCGSSGSTFSVDPDSLTLHVSLPVTVYSPPVLVVLRAEIDFS